MAQAAANSKLLAQCYCEVQQPRGIADYGGGKAALGGDKMPGNDDLLAQVLGDKSTCTGKHLPKEAQTHPCIEPRKDPCAPAHNELICHTMGEKRQHYLKELQRILDKVESTDCPTTSSLQDTYGTGGQGEHDRPMMKYPGYVDYDSPKFKQPYFAPMITNLPTREKRPTSEISKFQGQNSYNVEYVPIESMTCQPWALPRKKSFELRASILYKGCDCSKHNGLQDRCERSDCNGAPSCLTQPLPSCTPSQAFVNPPSQRPVMDMVREVINRKHVSNKTYCCCPNVGIPKFKNIAGKDYTDCNHMEGPGKFECYKCRQD